MSKPKFRFNKLNSNQKLLAIHLKYYDGQKWSPKKGDYYTSSRNDLELYKIVNEDSEFFYTNYCDNIKTTDNPSSWKKDQFLKDFGEKRVYVPNFILTGILYPNSDLIDLDSLNEVMLDFVKNMTVNNSQEQMSNPFLPD